MLQRQALNQFYFTSAFLYNSGEELDGLAREKNLLEWKLLLKERFAKNEIDLHLYDFSYDTWVAKLEAEPSEQDAFFQFMSRKENKEIRETILFIKKSELIRSVRSFWDFKNEGLAKSESLVPEGKELYKRLSSSNLKCRIAFQLLKLCENKEFESIYSDYLVPVQFASLVGNWANMEAGGYYHRKNQRALSNLYYARTFSKCDEKKRWSYINFNADSGRVALACAVNKSDSLSLLFLMSLRNPGRTLQAIQQFRKLNPPPEYMEMLILREVNKLEDWILTREFTRNQPSIYEWHFEKENRASDLQYLRKLRQYLESITPRRREDALWNMAISYLYWMDKNPQKAKIYLNKAKKSKDLNLPYEVQMEILDINIELQSGLNNSESVKDRIYTLFTKLKKLKSDDSWEELQSNLFLALGQGFHKKGDQVNAALCYSRVRHHIPSHTWYAVDGPQDNPYYDPEYNSSLRDKLINYFFYLEDNATTESIREVHELAINPSQNARDSFFLEIIRKDPYRLKDLLATRYFREDKYYESLVIFNQIPHLYWDTCDWEVYHDLHETAFKATPFQSAGTISYYAYEEDKISDVPNKCVVADSMYRWNKALKEGSRPKGELYWKMAQVQYNCTYHGKLWMMNHYWFSIYDDPSETDFDRMPLQRKKEYFGSVKAHDYYLKAYEYSQNTRIKAYSLGMAGRCELDYDDMMRQLKKKKLSRSTNSHPPSHRQLMNRYPLLYKELYDDCLGYVYFFSKN